MDFNQALKQRVQRIRSKGLTYKGPTKVVEPKSTSAPRPVAPRSPPPARDGEAAQKRLQKRKHKRRTGSQQKRLKILRGEAEGFVIPTIFDLTVVLKLADWCIPFFSGTGSILSNFAPNLPFFWRGENWYSSEQAYQWAKMDCLGIQHLRQKLWSRDVKNSPIACKRVGKDREVIRHCTHKTPQIKKWLECQVSVMKEILMAKFTQNEVARKFLCDSYPKYLAEATADAFWGIGVLDRLTIFRNPETGEKFVKMAELPPPDEWGTNTLGLVLMELRVTLLFDQLNRAKAKRARRASGGSAPQASSQPSGSGLAGPSAANAQVARVDPIPVITLE